MGRDNGRLVEVTVKAVGDGELTLETLNAAFRTIMEPLRRSAVQQRRAAGQADGLVALARAWDESGGEITDRYLAHLAVAYEQVSRVPGHRAVNETLADAIGRPVGTVKGHVLRARKAGFLSPTGMGRGGGAATEEARKIVADQG
ncbi:hypothetical protein ACL02T_08555 [Pseudonocardia sp. RS010]|uniref:hypothetical protein n=1 Tax=Pseudonocardia sp. RS010 TaxID=3385979 RepID=UPI0039A1E4C7